MTATPSRFYFKQCSALRSDEDHLVAGAINLNTLGGDAFLFHEGLVDDAAIVGVHGLHLNDVAPAARFLGGFLGFYC